MRKDQNKGEKRISNKKKQQLSIKGERENEKIRTSGGSAIEFKHRTGKRTIAGKGEKGKCNSHFLLKEQFSRKDRQSEGLKSRLTTSNIITCTGACNLIRPVPGEGSPAVERGTKGTGV